MTGTEFRYCICDDKHLLLITNQPSPHHPSSDIPEGAANWLNHCFCAGVAEGGLKCVFCGCGRAAAARGGGAAALPGLRVAARARAGVGAAQRVGRQRAAVGRAGAAGGRAAALHGAVRRQRRAHPLPAHRRAPAADGHHARQNGECCFCLNRKPLQQKQRTFCT